MGQATWTSKSAGETKRIGITRIHVEEDAAKNIHGSGATAVTIVDFNRGGTPLIEIVSDPDLRSSEEAEAYLRKLRDLLMFIGVNDGNLEEGSFRCDANVSIRPVGQEELGTRAELKNINSFRFVKKAIDHEIARQEGVLQSGGTVVQETRTWSEAQGKTISMRSKEEAHDYRYFPDPDLPPVVVTEERIAALRAALPELPEAKQARWQKELGLTEYDAGVLSAHPEIAKYFEEATRSVRRTVGREGEGRWEESGQFRAGGSLAPRDDRRAGGPVPRRADRGGGASRLRRRWHDQREDREDRVCFDGGDGHGSEGSSSRARAWRRSPTPEPSRPR